VEGLSKIFTQKVKSFAVTAIDDLTLKVERGKIFGLLGPNGAGKTTFVKVLLGITIPTVGTARILSEDIRNYKIRRKIGYLPENHKFPPYLTAEQVLKYFSKMSGFESPDISKRIDELLDLVGISKWRKVKTGKFSKGMMQRLGLAQAIIHEPELIFLDEPTDGVDPIGRKEIRDILVSLKEQGKTLFLNSHLLSEVELVSDKVGILHKGRLIREGNIEELTAVKKTYRIETGREISGELKNELPGIEIEDEEDNKYLIKFPGEENMDMVIDKLRSNNISIKSIVPLKSSLEESFLSLIKSSEVN
jgi:ABC-2 type transport system ATP-binding protein